MTKNYIVIENTPGYMPEDMDPPTYDSYAEALHALVARNNEVADMMLETGERWFEVSPIVDGGFTYMDNTKNTMTDLGRVVQIYNTEED